MGSVCAVKGAVMETAVGQCFAVFGKFCMQRYDSGDASLQRDDGGLGPMPFLSRPICARRCEQPLRLIDPP